MNKLVTKLLTKTGTQSVPTAAATGLPALALLASTRRQAPPQLSNPRPSTMNKTRMNKPPRPSAMNKTLMNKPPRPSTMNKTRMNKPPRPSAMNKTRMNKTLRPSAMNKTRMNKSLTQSLFAAPKLLLALLLLASTGVVHAQATLSAGPITNTDGVVSAGTTYLNVGDTLTVQVNSDEALAASSLTDAAQFEFADSANPPLQDFVTTATDNQYTTTYTVRDGDNGTITVNVVGVTGTDSTAANTFTYAIPDYVLDTTVPDLTLTGEAYIAVAVGAEYTDAGAVTSDANATITSTLTSPDGTTLPTGINGFTARPNTDTVGTYTYTYTATDLAGNTATTTRQVAVGAPTLTLTYSHVGGLTPGSVTFLNLGDTLTVTVTSDIELATDTLVGAIQFELRFADNPPPQDLVATATDNQYQAVYTIRDGDAGRLTFKLSGVTSSAGVPALAIDQIIPNFTPDTEPPAISLNGEAVVGIEIGGSYTDPGASTSDSADDIVAVVIAGPGGATALDPATAGIYTYTYTATDLAGNTAEITRTVSVGDITAPLATFGAVTVRGVIGTPQTVGLTFDEVVTGLTPEHFSGADDISLSGSGDTYIVTFTPTATAFTLTLAAASVTDASGNANVAASVPGTATEPPNTRPTFHPDTSAESEYAENDTIVIVTYRATDAEGHTITWTITGADAGFFTIDPDSGDLTFNTPPDFESAHDPIYEVTVTGTDDGTPPMSVIGDVRVIVQNSEEAGSISAITGTAQVGMTLTAGTITDPDSPNPSSPVTVTAHLWQNTDGSDITGIANTPTYTPTATEVGKTIEVMVTYNDGHGAGKTVTSTPTQAVRAEFATESSDANLSALTISEGTLPPFAAATTAYNAGEVAHDVASVTVTPTVNHAAASVTVAFVEVTSGTPSAAIPLAVGANNIGITVTAEDASTKTYTVTITRAAPPPANADLSGVVFTPTPDSITPAFQSGVYMYTVNVASDVDEITTTPTVNDASASLTVDRTMISSGDSYVLDLDPGINTLDVVVSVGALTETYRFQIVRALMLSSNANLGSVTITDNNGMVSGLNEDITADTTSYTATVATDANEFTVMATPDNSAALSVDVADSGEDSETFTFTGDSVSLNVVITAADGTTKAYTITVTRAADTTVPSVDFGGATITEVGVIGEELEHDFTFSEEVTGLAINDFTVVGARITNIGGSGGDAYTLAITPSARTFTITLNANSVTDLNGNDGPAENPLAARRVTGTAANQAPVAEAGDAQSVIADAVVTLDGSATDPDGDALTYSWTQTSGTNVTLNDAAIAGPTFTAPATAAVLVFELTVTDDSGDSATNTDSDTVTITVTAPPKPVIVGSGAVSHAENTETVAAYTATQDADGNSISVTWTRSGADADSFAISGDGRLGFANDPNYEDPQDADADNVYQITVTATDSTTSASSELAVTITVTNVDETGRIAAISGAVQAEQTLTAGAVTDPDSPDPSSPVTVTGHLWQNTDGSTITGTTNAATYMPTATEVGETLEVIVTYTDGHGPDKSVTSAATVVVLAASVTLSADADLSALTLSAGALVPAFAAATVDYTAEVGNAVARIRVTPTVNDATASVTVAGTAVASGAASAAIALDVGANTIDIVVAAQDGTEKTYTVTVTRDAPNTAPTVNAGPDQSVTFSANVILSGTATDPDQASDTLTYLWTQSSGTNVTLNDAATATAAFTAPDSAATLEFTLTVTDAASAAITDTLTITVVASDTTAPTAVLATPTDSVIGTRQSVSLTFDEEVTGLTDADFSASSGVIGIMLSGSGTTYVLSFIPNAASFTLTLSADSVSDTAATPNSGPASALSVTASAAPASVPSVDLGTIAAGVTGTEQTHNIIFSEVIDGFDESDLSESTGATVSDVANTGDSITWAITFTPTATSFTLTLTALSVTDVNRNAGPVTAQSVSGSAIDGTAPTATFATLAEGMTGIAQTAILTFDEVVTGLTDADFSDSAGVTEISVANTGDGITYRITHTPTVAAFTLTLAAGSVSDTAATPNSGPTNALSLSGSAIDTTAPTVNFGPLAEGMTGIAQTVRLIFSEAVEGLVASALSASTGVEEISVADTGDGIIYHITFTPTAQIFTLRLAVNAVQDTAATPNSGPASELIAHGNALIPEQPPTADAGHGQSLLVGVEVRLDGSASSDPNQESNTLDYVWEHTETDGGAPATPIVLSNPNARRPAFDATEVGTFTFTLTVTDATGESDTDTTFVSIDPSDDTIRPVVTLGTITAGVVGIEQTHTITFDELVTKLNRGDFSGSVGLTVNKVTPSQGPSDTYDIDFTPTAPEFTLIIQTGSVQDASGNPNLLQTKDGTAGPPLMLDLDFVHTGGVERAGDTTLLNAGDTYTITLSSTRALTAASLVGAAQFHVRHAPTQPPAQNLVATGTEWEYQATYTVRPLDIGTVSFNVNTLTDVAGGVHEAFADPYTADIFADTSPPVVSLGAGGPRVVIPVGGTYDEDLSTTDSADDIVTTIQGPGGTTELDPDTAGLYVYTYTVTDAAGNVRVLLRTVTVGAAAANRAPLVTTSADQTVLHDVSVTLSGSATDLDVSDTLRYEWVQDSGTAVTLTGADTATATFTTTTPGILVFTITVSDDFDPPATGAGTVTITVSNTPPTTDAGGDRSVSVGQIVTLEGSASDPNQEDASLIFAWEHTLTDGVAPTVPIMLTGADTARPTFTAPATVGVLSFGMTVTDSHGPPVSVTVTITVTSQPLVDVGAGVGLDAEQNVMPGAPVTLSGTATDPDGDDDLLTYAWVQTSGTDVTLSGDTTATATFTAPASGVLVFTLTVTDEDDDTTTSTVTVTANLAPMADVGGGLGLDAEQSVMPGAPVTLDGTGSRDPENGVLTYAWVHTMTDNVATTPTTAIALTNANTAIATFTAPASGVLAFTLTVTDDGGFTGTNTLTITAGDAPTATFGTIDEGVIGTAQTVSLTFNEAVTGLVATDITATGATVDSLSGSGDTYMITFTPTAAAFTLTLAAGSVEDTDSNAGPASAANVRGTAKTPPHAPVNLVAMVDLMTVQLTWEAPANDGGSAITGYEYRQAEGSAGNYAAPWTATTDSSSHTVTGLTGGTSYYFQVRALNVIGAGVASAEVSAMPPDTVAPEIRLIGASPMEVAQGSTFIDPGATASDAADGVLSGRIAVGGDTVDTDTLGEYTITYDVSDAAGNAADTVTRIVIVVRDIAALNAVILPEVARAMADQHVSAIVQRLEQARLSNIAGATSSSASLGGASSLTGIIKAQGRAIADDQFDLKRVLAGSDFVLPLNGAGGGASGSGAQGFTLWGAGDYRSMDGSDGARWDGDLFSLQLGLDKHLNEQTLVGISVSKTEAELDYTTEDGTASGDYDLDMTGVHTYLGWTTKTLDFWATFGHSQGELEIIEATPKADVLSSDLSMQTLGAGASGVLMETDFTTLRLKAEAVQTQLEVKSSAQLASQDLDVRRLRMTLEATRKHTMHRGGQLVSSVEVGARQDGGDGKTGAGTELGVSLRYASPGGGLSMQSKAQLLVDGKGDTDEWGLSGTISFQPLTNGRGLSFSLKPGYGVATGGVQQLWQQGLIDEGLGASRQGGSADYSRDYSPSLEVRLDYGMYAPRGPGLMTPYTELSFGDSGDTYRLGVQWQRSKAFDLKLVTERKESTTTTDHRIYLKGELAF